MELRAISALSGEVLFAGVVASYAHLLRRLAPLPGSLGFRLLLGCSEVLCDQELMEEYGRAQERPVSVSVLHDHELQVRLSYVEGGVPILKDWWSDRAFLFHACRIRPPLAPHACEGRRDDRAFLLHAIATNKVSMRFVGRCEASFYVAAVAANPLAYAYLSSHVRCAGGTLQRQLAVAALREPSIWHLLPNSYEDIAAYLEALEESPTVRPRRAAAEVWHTRVPPSPLQHAQQNIMVRSCRSLVTRAVARCWRDLKFATWDVRADRAVVSTAVACHWRALQYASAELRGDRELLLTAVKQNGLALCFASDALRADEELARLAVQAQRRALQYVSRALVAKWSSLATVLPAPSGGDDRATDASTDSQAQTELPVWQTFDAL